MPRLADIVDVEPIGGGDIIFVKLVENDHVVPLLRVDYLFGCGPYHEFELVTQVDLVLLVNGKDHRFQNLNGTVLKLVEYRSVVSEKDHKLVIHNIEVDNFFVSRVSGRDINPLIFPNELEIQVFVGVWVTTGTHLLVDYNGTVRQ